MEDWLREDLQTLSSLPRDMRLAQYLYAHHTGFLRAVAGELKIPGRSRMNIKELRKAIARFHTHIGIGSVLFPDEKGTMSNNTNKIELECQNCGKVTPDHLGNKDGEGWTIFCDICGKEKTHGRIHIEEETEEEIYIFLTCTSHGKPIWMTHWNSDYREINLPDQSVRNPPPIRILQTSEDMEIFTENNHVVDIDLDDHSTWFPNPNWIEEYFENGFLEELDGRN